MESYIIYIQKAGTVYTMYRLIFNSWMYKWKSLLCKLQQETSGIAISQIFILSDISERHSVQVYSTVYTDI